MNIEKLPVAVVRGGTSREREVSMWSGAEVLAVLGDDGLDVVLSADGSWLVGGNPPTDAHSALHHLRSNVRLVFIALHGVFGEDGTLQALLEAHGLRYTGSGQAASALAMDKVRTKLVYIGEGLPTPPAVYRLRGDDTLEVAERAVKKVLGPWVVNQLAKARASA